MDLQTETTNDGTENSPSGKTGEYRADFVMGIFLFIFGLYVLLESTLNMPLPNISWDEWYTAPGVFPAFLGSMLMLTAVMLFVKAVKMLRRYQKFDFSVLVDVIKSKRTARCALAALFFIIYLYVFWGMVNYILGTFLFLVMNMLVFDTKKRTLKRVVLHLVIAASAAAIIAYVFGNFARIPLP
jgi:hypothetical protein